MMRLRTSAAAATFALLLASATLAAPSYDVERISPPDGVALEVGGIEFSVDGKLMMCTRRGEVWAYEPESKKWTQYARGLQEALGLRVGKKGEVFVLQRCELTRLLDKDGDGKADLYETINRDWGFTANYHEYALGLVRDKEGNFYFNLGLSFIHGGDRFKGSWLGVRTDNPYRGWHIKVTPEGKFIPWAPGLRAPNGVGMNLEGDIFTTDNQGSYINTSHMVHATKGDFLGHPSGLQFDPRYKDKLDTMEESDFEKLRKRPAIFFPHGVMGNSISEPHWDDTQGKFGPYAGQAFIGDVIQAHVTRIALEKIQGEYQGACFPFLRGKAVGGGSNRFEFGPDGSLWVGQTARGWGRGEGLLHVKWNKTVPMEMHNIKVTRKGFDITFTHPVSKASATALGSYEVESFYYKYSHRYGGPRVDTKTSNVMGAKLSADGKTVSLTLSDMPVHRIFEIKTAGIKSSKGQSCEFGQAWYTLNRLPN
jgi:hypothetical protein